MKKFQSSLILSIFVLASGYSTYSQVLNFNYGLSPFGLINGYFVGNSIVISNATGNLVPNSSAAFTNGNSINLGIDSGFVITTGSLISNSSSPLTFLSTSLNLPGDSLLNAMIAPGSTLDAQYVEFDFVAISDTLEFEFIFASEEYNEFVNTQFSDVFGVFISGPGYNNPVNVATLPGTNWPISINLINNGGPYSGAASGPCNNCAYFIDNLSIGTSGNYPVQFSFDGLTTVLKAKFYVVPCELYRMKIVIADMSDQIYDSAIMFKKNSFKPVSLLYISHNDIPITSGTINLCAGGSLTLTAPNAPSYYWAHGDTTQTIIVTQPGVYQHTIVNLATSCFGFTEVNVVLQGSIQTPVIMQAGTNLVSNVIPAIGLTYQWFIDGVLIPGATNDTLPLQGDGCYTLMIYEGTCESISNIICITGTSIYEVNSSSISIIPHPVSDVSIIKTPFQKGTTTSLNLFDLSGKLVFSKSESTGPDITLTRNNITPGIYFIEIRNNVSPDILKGKVVFSAE